MRDGKIACHCIHCGAKHIWKSKRKIILANLKIWRSQNATLLRKSAPWRPNICDAARHASFQILFKCPTPAIVFLELRVLQNPHVLLTFGKVQNPLRHAQPHLNLQKWSEHVVLLTFWLGNALRATMAPTFSTSQLPKVLRKLVCFVGFDFEICFAPQRCPLFRHVNFQKCSDTEVLCTFWLGHVLRATTACIFSTVARACATLRMTWPHFCVAGAALYTDGVENRKTHWHEAVSSALNFPFLKEVSQNCLVFWLSFWCRQLRKLKEVSQNCFVFDVANFENWGSLAEVLRFWCCQVQNWGSLAE